MDPLVRYNIRREERWAARRLVRCPECGVRVFEYDQARHAAKHEREATDQKVTARKQRAKDDGQ